MITIRRSNERGQANHGWLETRHTFSFASYYDPRWMGFRDLRVINEDVIAGGSGFDTHPHRDMEIITYILSGALRHRDSMGHEAVLKPGEVQRISAGSGITHSEHNYSPVDPVHLLQIWIQPKAKGVKPSYEERTLPRSDRPNDLTLIASPDARQGSVTLQQDAELWVARLASGSLTHPLRPGRHAWIQVAQGSLSLNGQALSAGDGAAVSQESSLSLEGDAPSQALIFDLS